MKLLLAPQGPSPYLQLLLSINFTFVYHTDQYALPIMTSS